MAGDKRTISESRGKIEMHAGRLEGLSFRIEHVCVIKGGGGNVGRLGRWTCVG